MVRKDDTVKTRDWLTDSLSWKNIYLEQYGRATFSPNPYVVESGRAMAGIYKYEQPTQTIQFTMHPRTSVTDTFYATVTKAAADHMQWKMACHKDTVCLLLTKMPEDLYH